jgi:hypothetical protein
VKKYALIILTALIAEAPLIYSQTNENSYLANPAKKGILFEGQIAPSYELFHLGKEADKMKRGFSLDAIITPKVLLKVYSSQSRPLQSPSYMPMITFEACWKTDAVGIYPFVTIGHHSNGQTGTTYDSSGHINTRTGDFYTNFVKLGYAMSAAAWPHHKIGIVYEIHPVHGWWFSIDEAIKGSYGRKRIHCYYSYERKNVKAEVNYTRIYDSWELAQGVSPNILEINFSWRLPGLQNLASLFTNFYQGQDYYNIDFARQIRQFKMGLAIHTKLISL